MGDQLQILLVGLLVLGTVALVLWRVFGRSSAAPQRDEYMHALELWIEGELDDAAALLHKVVHSDTGAVGPFLHLGKLLRLRGDAQRAAVLHRGLTVRPDLSLADKIAVGLALAEDLNALAQWEESGTVLDSLLRHATGRSTYWRARFAQRWGQGNLPEAARTLKNALKHVPRRDHDWFRGAYISFQLDRALQHALAGEARDTKARLKDVRDYPQAESRAALVTAIAAATANDATTAVTVASEQLLNHPDELRVFLPLLQEVLLQTGQYARTVPILERACQAETAPASLWIDLALLYEKIGQREKALRFLESKSGRAELTPAAAAPYLRILMADTGEADVARVWDMLSISRNRASWCCRECGQSADRVRWFCPACRAFDSYAAVSDDPGEV